MEYYLTKTKQITISPITCSKGHTFYPKVLPTGEIQIYLKCPVRDCRVYLDSKSVKLKLMKKNLNLKNRWKKHNPVKTKTVQVIKNIEERPVCRICNLTFYDQKNFETHNKRLHQQR